MRSRLARRQGDVAVAQDALEGGEAGGRIATLTLLLRDDHLGRWSHVALNGLAEITNGHLVELVAIGEVIALCANLDRRQQDKHERQATQEFHGPREHAPAA